MKTLEAKPFDQYAENRKRENRLFISTVLEAGTSGQNRIGTHALRSHPNSLILFRCSNSCFLLETDIAGHERLFLAKWHPKAEKKLRKRRFFDTADRHEKLYGRSRLYASAQGRHETGGVLSLFSRFSFDISIKNSVQRWSSDFQGLFRVKIKKMAQGSDDLSTLPLITNWNHTTRIEPVLEESCHMEGDVSFTGYHPAVQLFFQSLLWKYSVRSSFTRVWRLDFQSMKLTGTQI